MSALSRYSPLTGAAAIGLAVAGLATDQAPTSAWSDDRTTAWYAAQGNAEWLLSAALIGLAAPFLLLFTATVVVRLAEHGAGRAARVVVQGAGTAWAVVLLVGAGLYAAVPAGRTFTSAPAPDPSVSRYLLGASYGTLVMFSALAAATFALAVSIVGLRTRALPRWLAVAGLPASVLMLANALLPMAVITLWTVVTSVTLTLSRRRQGVPAPRTPQPVVPAPAR
jgi:hypothetical protein